MLLFRVGGDTCPAGCAGTPITCISLCLLFPFHRRLFTAACCYRGWSFSCLIKMEPFPRLIHFNLFIIASIQRDLQPFQIPNSTVELHFIQFWSVIANRVYSPPPLLPFNSLQLIHHRLHSTPLATVPNSTVKLRLLDFDLTTLIDSPSPLLNLVCVGLISSMIFTDIHLVTAVFSYLTILN